MVEKFEAQTLTENALTSAGDLSRFAMGLVKEQSLATTGQTNFEPDFLNTDIASLPGYGDEHPELDGAVVPEAPATEVPEDKENLVERFQSEPPACEQLDGHEGLEDLLDMTWSSYENALKTLPPELQSNDAFMDNLSNYPNLIYSGQTNQAAVTKYALLKAAEKGGRPELEEYFESINNIAKENPELVAEITSAQKLCKPGEN